MGNTIAMKGVEQNNTTKRYVLRRDWARFCIIDTLIGMV